MQKPINMFISVKYGDDELEIFNANCISVVLLACIKETCGIVDDSTTIDLCDETGLVKNLSSHADEYASNYLAHRGIYILVKVDRK